MLNKMFGVQNRKKMEPAPKPTAYIMKDGTAYSQESGKPVYTSSTPKRKYTKPQKKKAKAPPTAPTRSTEPVFVSFS
jgi:hypothetical protein